MYSAIEATEPPAPAPAPLKEDFCYNQTVVTQVGTKLVFNEAANKSLPVPVFHTNYTMNCTNYTTAFPEPAVPYPTRTLCMGGFGSNQLLDTPFSFENYAAMKNSCAPVLYQPIVNGTNVKQYVDAASKGWLQFVNYSQFGYRSYNTAPAGGPPLPTTLATEILADKKNFPHWSSKSKAYLVNMLQPPKPSWGVFGWEGGYTGYGGTGSITEYNPVAVAQCPLCYSRNLQVPTTWPLCLPVPPPWKRPVFQKYLDTSLVFYGMKLGTFNRLNKPMATKLSAPGMTTVVDIFKTLLADNAILQPATVDYKPRVVTPGANATEQLIVVDQVNAQFLCDYNPADKLQHCWDTTVMRFFIQVNTTNDLAVQKRLNKYVADTTATGLQEQLVKRLEMANVCTKTPITPATPAASPAAGEGRRADPPELTDPAQAEPKFTEVCVEATPDPYLRHNRFQRIYVKGSVLLKAGTHPAPTGTGGSAALLPCRWLAVAMALLALYIASGGGAE
jgi:hypothetical protein